ncbi:uncharacterized protein LOC123667002 [Melitaea cinxia]|uniref:uncharacterized protein LOC123667002 n=1 Tax=Melitaea cinxia TaxID=113334 RepID=UPI001E2730F0|nr:uncharacterized protein LOC123667002 [Melitaea cinxia]
MTESTNVKIKAEQPDEAEIRELAAKMVEANKAKVLTASVAAARSQPEAILAAPVAVAGLSAVGGQNMVMGKFLTVKPGTQQQKPAEPRRKFDDKKTPAPDEASWKGHFGWDTLGECHIPYIYRSGEKYVAVRMVEIKLLNKYLNYQHVDLYSFTCIQSYYITEIEARLLNDINNRYCDGQFGSDPFTQKDLVVRLMEAYEFYNFLDVCYNKLLRGTTNNDKCGFIMINKESAVPYTVRDGKKLVPLFYFEGEMDSLKLKAEQLKGWDISYLKFCCKVQGIRNELFTSETCSVISLTDIKSYFPPGTEFEEYWPNKVVKSQLFNSANGSVSGGRQWTKAPPAPPLGAESGLVPDTTIQMAMGQQPTLLLRSTDSTTGFKTVKVAKTNAQRQREFQQRKRNQKKSTKKPPKTNAEHQREYRKRQKMKKNLNKGDSNAVNAPSTTKKTHAEYCKEYYQKCKLKKQLVQLHALLSDKGEVSRSFGIRGTSMDEATARAATGGREWTVSGYHNTNGDGPAAYNSREEYCQHNSLQNRLHLSNS